MSRAGAEREQGKRLMSCWRRRRFNWCPSLPNTLAGNHPAALNFGDCFAYALAEATGEPLLFKGEDFARTDIEAA